jgi:hypothetical protein
MEVISELGEVHSSRIKSSQFTVHSWKGISEVGEVHGSRFTVERQRRG